MLCTFSLLCWPACKTHLIISLPGSPNAVKEYLDALFPAVLHGLQILNETDSAQKKHFRQALQIH